MIVALIILYLLLIVSLGLIAKKRGSDSVEDFFLAGRNVKWFLLGFTIFASWMSTFAFLGSPGLYFKLGVTWYLPHSFLVVASPLLLWLLGRRIWELSESKNYLTPADFFADRFQSKTIGYIVAVLCVIALIPYCAIQLIGIGKALESGSEGFVSYHIGVLLAVAGVSFYSMIGGIRAVIWSDILQAVMFMLVLILAVFKAIEVADGISNGYLQAVGSRPEAFIFNESKPGLPITLLLIWTFGFVLLPHMWQRIYMAKDRESLGKSILLSSSLAFLFICLPSMLVGTLLIGVYDLGDLGDTDKLIPIFFVEFLPVALPLLLVATFAAGMSTIDSQLMSASSVFSNDILKKRSKSIGRAFLVVFIAIILFVSLSPYARENIVFIASKGTSIAFMLLVPLLFALLQKTPSRVIGITTLVIGIVVLMVLELKLLDVSLPMSFGAPIAAAVLQGLIGLFIQIFDNFGSKNRHAEI